jgi:translation initiation factor 2-alpha kinase 4
MFFIFQAKRQKAEEEAEQEHEREARLADELNRQILADAQKQHMEREKHFKARNRSSSEATAIPYAGDTPIESFNREIEAWGVRFNAVKFFHPRKGENHPTSITVSHEHRRPWNDIPGRACV